MNTFPCQGQHAPHASHIFRMSKHEFRNCLVLVKTSIFEPSSLRVEQVYLVWAELKSRVKLRSIYAHERLQGKTFKLSSSKSICRGSAQDPTYVLQKLKQFRASVRTAHPLLWRRDFLESCTGHHRLGGCIDSLRPLWCLQTPNVSGESLLRTAADIAAHHCGLHVVLASLLR